MNTQKIKDFLQSDMGLKVFLTGAITIAGIVVYYLFFAGAEKQMTTEEKTAGIDVGVQDTIFKKRKNVYYSTGKEGKKKIMSDKDFFEFKETVNELNQIVDSAEAIETTETDYQKIADSILLANQQKVSYGERGSNSSQRSYTATRPKKSTAEKKIDEEEAYRQQLIQGREEMLQHHRESNKRYQKNTVTEAPEPIAFRASIYQDQYILPGDRVTLVLNNDLIYNNKRFPKGTFIYAFATMGQSRVFLEVDNIAHVPIVLIAQDITDGRTGLYSTRAGELWLEYKDEFQDDTNQEFADAASDVTSSSLVGSALRGLASFFKKKKIRKKDKILLVNDHELILTNKEN